jgi:hypothetical protein
MTNFFEPFATHGPEQTLAIEIQQGKNIADAAAATSTLKHCIWSTLPNSSKISNGKYKMPHFEGKNRINEYIHSLTNLLAKTTFLWITAYAQNYQFPTYTPVYVKSSGKYVQLAATGPEASILSIGDVTKNIGIFTSAFLAQPELTHGRFVLAYVEETTAGSMLETWSKATGKRSVFVKTSIEDYDAVWQAWGLEIGAMMRFWEEAGEKSWSGEEVLTKEDLGIQGETFAGIEETFKTMDCAALLEC